MEITENQREIIAESVSDMFYQLAIKLLGEYFKGPKIYFTVLNSLNPLNTLAGIYKYTLSMTHGPGIEPDEDRVKKLNDITWGYLESQRHKTINHVLMAVEKGDDLQEVREEITKQIDKVTKHVDVLVNTEVRTSQAYAERQGIERLGASLGIDDPTVVKLGVVDNKLCKTCKSLWHVDSNIRMPKPYKLSELKGGYCDPKEPEPTEGPSHPRCRHVLTFCPPGYGFSDRGVVQFKSFDYDYLEDMRK